MSLIRGAIRHRQVTFLLTAMVVAAGFQALFQMPRREDPKITIRMALVVAAYPGATPEQVEEQLTRRLEERLFRFAEVRKEKTYSTTRNGLVIVNVAIEDWVTQPEVFWSTLRDDLSLLRATGLPDGVRGPIVNSDFGDTVAMLIAVFGGGFDSHQLRDQVRDLEESLRTLPAVSKLRRLGEQGEQIAVTSTLERLAQYGIAPARMVQALQSQNVVEESGGFETESAKIPFHATGLFLSEQQIRRQIVGISPAGQAIRIGDFAQVERRDRDPTSLIRVNGAEAVLLAVEMQEGNNVVKFGHEVNAKIAAVAARFPRGVEMVLIANQPEVVEHRINHFLREFVIAIVAVIIVTMLLLPLPVATIAAVAIPVSVAVTFAALQALGIELHQVSLAGLIVSLGIVVDDAIVVADNYVELLDHGIAPDEAAPRSAQDLVVPVLAATATIVASFLPLIFLSGTTGEFINALPVTVTVALASSFAVAMLLTPALCRLFIRRGLKPHGETGAPARKRFPSPLDLIQRWYDRLILRAMAHRSLTLAMGATAVVAGALLYVTIDQRFFPPSERAQFVVDLWLPEGARLAATDRVARRLEAAARADTTIVSVATFVGAGAPRFYYNFEPEFEAANFAQLLIATTAPEAALEAAARLRSALPRLAPEGSVHVRFLQQGPAMKAPLELRLVGPDVATLKQIGERVAGVFRATPGAALIQSDFREDSYRVTVTVKPQVANQLGISTARVARTLAGSFLGVPVSMYWEGDRSVPIVLRLDESRRESFDNVTGAYLTSDLTGARVPLREVATLEPTWQTSRIVHRNGTPTLTVRSQVEPGVLPADVLARAAPGLDTLTLPAGYRRELGGEIESRRETFREMLIALATSLLAIFLILLLLFKRVSETLVVMAAIPLSLFGALLGLILTGNPFGFTAFVGLIALSGIVVRNAIILVDFSNAQRRAGVPIEQAALEAGRRRLRPIFLTTMAAAVGVLPMILSGSGMWSPLASVLAVGLISSMVLTLFVVPVLVVVVGRRQEGETP